MSRSQKHLMQKQFPPKIFMSDSDGTYQEDWSYSVDDRYTF